ncbi:major capsid protein [Hahella sp. HN01]|uniref:major capsid protein n=1 Tax=Hahella sp. HN01 TaxID=2847262 RepID=UPI001C1F16B2|nr:major capsid protein [Hahella sp. HN01]MBU6954532.1 major capsid protein [Hahella sp. HN01]
MSYETSTLLSVMQEMDRNIPFLLSLFFTEEIMFDTDEIDFDAIDEDVRIAPFVSPLVAGQVMKERGSTLKKFKAAYIKPKTPVLPNRPLKRRAGEPIGGTLTPAQRMNAIRADILNSQMDSIDRRMEWMAASALRTGQIIVSGEKYPTSVVDFGRDPNLTVDVSGGAAAWDQSTSTPKEDLEDIFALMKAPCNYVIGGRGAINAFMKHADIKELIETRRGSSTQLETAPTVNLADYKGRLGSAGPEVWSYQGYYTDEGGAQQLYIPDDEVILVSMAVEGVQAFGAILDGEAGYMPARYFPKNWAEKDPPLEYLMTQSSPLTVPKRINGTAKIKVL